ncbi:MAG: ElyC/SanA/YdcF family protein, partial [Bacteroidota bacterium]
MRMKLLLKASVALSILALLLFSFVCLCNLWLIRSTEQWVYEDLDQVPVNEVALVLGANPLIRGKWKNPYFHNRIDAAYQLYRSGKAKHFILSGDNHKHAYNEPEEMKKALMAKGVPASAITLDFAGFRTLDSVIRANTIFQQHRFTILSQEFHNYRALFIARKNGIDAVAYNAAPVNSLSKKTIYREY